MFRIIFAAMTLLALSLPVQARPHHHRAHGASAPATVSLFGFGGGGLVSRARSYLGTNPTGMRHLWCARFMAMIAPGSAKKVRNPDWARSWLALPHTSPRVGAFAVMARRGGGHIGIVSGFDASGNPIIVSGNNMGAVREGAYPKSRVLAYVNAD